MPNPRKKAPTLNTQDLSIKRLIEFHPCTIADISNILQLTSNQVRASLEKLTHPARNDVFPITYVNETGRRNIYFPNVLYDPSEIKFSRYAVKRGFTDGIGQMESIEDKVKLLVALDNHFKVVYTGLAAAANRRKDNPEQ